MILLLNNIELRIISCVGLLVIMLLLFSSPLMAANIPSWLVPSSPDRTASAEEVLWLVLAGSDDDHAFAGMEVMAVPAFVPDYSKDSLFNMHLDYEKDGMTFHFGREQIAYILFYSSCNYSLYGVPVICSYASLIRLRNGDVLEGNRKAVFPEGALFPWRFRYDKTQTVEYYGQRQERREESSFSRPVLALAWSRVDAEAARHEILLRAGASDAVRTHVDWDVPTRV